MNLGNTHDEAIGATPCLKWAGGKQWCAPALASVLRSGLTGTYYEPFLGGGAVFLQIAPGKAFLSDINIELVEFFQCIRDFPEAVVRATWRLSNTKECFYRIRAMHPRSHIQAGARFLYLNKTCWGGLFRTNRNGQFNVPFGNSGRTICRRDPIIVCSHVLRTARIEGMDFEEAINMATHGDVVYADPPYTTKGQNNGFLRYNECLFSWQDQMRLAKACKRAARRRALVAVSGLLHDEVLALYKGWWAWRLDRTSLISRDVASRRPVAEVVMFSRRPRVCGSKLGFCLERILA